MIISDSGSGRSWLPKTLIVLFSFIAYNLSYYKREQEILERERMATGDTISKADLSFASLDMPQCSGGAIGLDRLLLTEYGGDEIAPILSFPMCSMLKTE